MRCGALNESPSEKEGKSAESASDELLKAAALNESPSEKEGKCQGAESIRVNLEPLNESPSEKEGKFGSAAARR